MKIKELQERYNLKTRQSVYNWLGAAGVELAFDERGHKYATPEQVEALDQLKQHLDDGGTFKHYTPVSVAVVEAPEIVPVYQEIDTPQDTALLLKVVEALASSPQQSPLWYHRELEEAAAVGWQLTTKEVKALIGVKPHGQEYQRGCWLFRRAGKIGVSIAWTVEKIS